VTIRDHTLFIEPTVNTDTCELLFNVAMQDMVEYRFTTDGTEPTLEATLYDGPQQLPDMCTVKVCAFPRPFQALPSSVVEVSADSEVKEEEGQEEAIPDKGSDVTI